MLNVKDLKVDKVHGSLICHSNIESITLSVTGKTPKREIEC